MKRWLRGLAIRITGNAPAQRILGSTADRLQVLMGIGAGALVETSGEATLIQKLRRLRPSEGNPLVVFDVGANEGAFVQMLRSGLSGVPARIHAFEPGPAAFRELSSRFGGAAGVILEETALGSAEGTIPLYSNRPGSPLASLYRRDLGRYGIALDRVERVSVTTVDRYCEARGIERIDLLKLDVEGHELEVLRGAERMLRERRVRSVTFEFGGCHIDSRTFFRDFHDLLTAAGLGRIYRITPSGFLAPIGPYREGLEQFGTTNYWASSDDS